MPFMVVGAIPYEIENNSLNINRILIGVEQRSQCGVLWGVDNGIVREGDAASSCLAPLAACNYIDNLDGLGETFFFANANGIGSRGTAPDSILSTFTVTGTGGPFDSYATVAIGDEIHLPVALPQTLSTGWSVQLFVEEGGLWRHYIISGFGSLVLQAYRDGVSVAVGTINPWFDVDSSGTVILSAFDTAGVPASKNYAQVEPMPFFIIPDIAEVMSTYASAEKSAGLPYQNISGDIFKDTFKARTRSLTSRRTILTTKDNVRRNNAYSFTFAFREHKPRVRL